MFQKKQQSPEDPTSPETLHVIPPPHRTSISSPKYNLEKEILWLKCFDNQSAKRSKKKKTACFSLLFIVYSFFLTNDSLPSLVLDIDNINASFFLSIVLDGMQNTSSFTRGVNNRLNTSLLCSNKMKFPKISERFVLYCDSFSFF